MDVFTAVPQWNTHGRAVTGLLTGAATNWELEAVGGDGHDFGDQGHRGLDRLR